MIRSAKTAEDLFVAETLKSASKKALQTESKLLPIGGGVESRQLVFQRALANLDFMHEVVLSRNTQQKVERNRGAQPLCGMLEKRTAKWIGMGKVGIWRKHWSKRWVELDPASGVLSYHRPLFETSKDSQYFLPVKGSVSSLSMPSLSGKKKPVVKHFPLENILWMQTQRSGMSIQLVFCDPLERRKIQKVVHLRTETNEDFDMWREVLSCYGIGCGGQTPKTPKETGSDPAESRL